MSKSVLIVGQGLAGTCLAWRLLEKGAHIHILDPEESVTSSLVAAGLMTPITGKSLDPSWRFTQFIRISGEFYRAMEKNLDVPLLYPMTINRIFVNHTETRLFEQRLSNTDFASLAQDFNSSAIPPSILAPLGGFSMPGGARLDVRNFILASRRHFQKQGCFEKATFSSDDLTGHSGKLMWNGHEFDAVVLCRGFKEGFSWDARFLQFEPNRGQMIRCRCENLETSQVWNQRGLWMMPLNEMGPGEFLIGATYNRMRTDISPDEASRNQILDRLGKFSREIPDSSAIAGEPVGIRPVIRGWKLVASPHPNMKRIFIFNGLGSKGALRAPYFAECLAGSILEGRPIEPGVDISSLN